MLYMYIMKLKNESVPVGIYVCSQCSHPLFSSRSKFPHSSPWPAFTETIREDSVTKMMETLTVFKVGLMLLEHTSDSLSILLPLNAYC